VATTDDFQLIGRSEQFDQALVRTPVSYWSDAWRRLQQNKAAIISFYVIIVIVLAAVVGPWLSPYSYSDQSLII
jgi:oligopeptide transport system permease protein